MTARSFFKKIMSSVKMENPSGDFNDNSELQDGSSDDSLPTHDAFDDEGDSDGQLGVDVYELDDIIYIKAMTAGVKKEDLEINLKREQVTIRGTRYDNTAPSDEYYVYQELYWGSFSRVIDLPDEVDIDRAEATEDHGLLTLKLPKIDKERSTKLEI